MPFVREGTVVDRTGLIFNKATVFVVDLAANARRKSEVQANGQFRFTALPIGYYSLHIESVGGRHGPKSPSKDGLYANQNLCSS